MPKTTEWSRVLVQAGAQYAVSTSRHHEGYWMWNSTDIATSWHWNVIDVGSKRDLLGELAWAIKHATSPQTGRPVKFGVYHSLFELHLCNGKRLPNCAIWWNTSNQSSFGAMENAKPIRIIGKHEHS